MKRSCEGHLKSLPSQPNGIDLQNGGIDEIQAADLRARLKTFAEDWNLPEADIYDEDPPK